MDKIRLAICDDMKYICDYFSMILSANEMFEVIGTAHSHEEVINLVKTKMPDVILLDLNFDKNNAGIEMIPEIKEINPECMVIIITVHDQGKFILDAITNGADNYLLKDLPVEELEKAIVDTCTNKNAFTKRLLKSIADEENKRMETQKSMLFFMNKISTLSPREFSVLQFLYTGKTYAEISEYLVIEKVTVRSYVSGILKKMGYATSKELIKDLNALNIMENLSRVRSDE